MNRPGFLWPVPYFFSAVVSDFLPERMNGTAVAAARHIRRQVRPLRRPAAPPDAGPAFDGRCLKSRTLCVPRPICRARRKSRTLVIDPLIDGVHRLASNATPP